MNAVAIVLASGSGLRFDSVGLSKHLTPILEVPVIVWALDSIINSDLFKSVVVVARENDLKITQETLNNYFSKDSIDIKITSGADERMQSFMLGLEYLRSLNLVGEDSMIALVDANRPFITVDQMKALYKSVVEFDCSCPARPIINGVARMNSSNIIEVPNKQEYFEFITPEFMNYNKLRISIENSKGVFSSLVEYALSINIKPITIEAYSINAKLTYPEDTSYLEGLALDHQLIKPKMI